MDKTDSGNPMPQFLEWYRAAEVSEPDLADAMTLATADADGIPSARMVLLKQVDERGFVFYTNLNSQKGREIGENPVASLVFHWKSLKRQVRITGPVETIADDEADSYFETRSRGAQIGAWASDQSSVMESAYDLEKRVAGYTLKFGVSKIPRPPFWTGFRVIPRTIEFWEQGVFRLHKRVRYTRDGDGWAMERLFP